MKKTVLAAIVLAAFVCTNADARGGRGFSGGRSVSARTYRAPAPKPKRNATVIQKNTTIINQQQTNVQNEGTSNSSGFCRIAYERQVEGVTVFRAVLEVPREWRRLNPTEQARRVLAQVKGQYGLSVVSLPFSGGQRMKIRETNQRHISG